MTDMRFHVLGMAHTQATKAYSSCAYTQKVRNFCRMMMSRGHEVYLYAGDEIDVPCTEHLVCVTKDEIAAACDGHYLNVKHSPREPHWIAFNGRACGYLASRARDGDFLCVIFGYAQKPVADAFPILKTVEYGVGYHHTFADHCVFESYAWMHSVYAARKGSSDIDGVWYDDVIHGYLDPDEFPLVTKKKDYLLYLGRLIGRKGLRVASQVAKATGRRLIVAGAGGTPPDGCTYVGEVGYEARAELLGNAHAVLIPTEYIEPFGNVAIEAMACGTPVITTDWGAFTETVQTRVGIRCRTLQEFVDAVDDVGMLEPTFIRRYAEQNFSLNVIAYEYECYFERLKTLWGEGWGQLRPKEFKNAG